MRSGGRILVSQPGLARFAQGLREDDHVVLEATGNTVAIVNALTAQVDRVVVANPLQVRLIAYSRIKTDKIDASILATEFVRQSSPCRSTNFARRVSHSLSQPISSSPGIGLAMK